jgi:hypothetical protein
MENNKKTNRQIINEACDKLFNGYSESRVFDFVLQECNNDKRAMALFPHIFDTEEEYLIPMGILTED